MDMTIWCVTNGKEKTWFPTKEDAKKFSDFLFNYGEDGIPFITGINIDDKQNVVNLLNGESL